MGMKKKKRRNSGDYSVKSRPRGMTRSPIRKLDDEGRVRKCGIKIEKQRTTPPPHRLTLSDEPCDYEIYEETRANDTRGEKYAVRIVTLNDRQGITCSSAARRIRPWVRVRKTRQIARLYTYSYTECLLDKLLTSGHVERENPKKHDRCGLDFPLTLTPAIVEKPIPKRQDVCCVIS